MLDLNKNGIKVALINIMYDDKIQDTIDYLGSGHIASYLELHNYIVEIFYIFYKDIDAGIQKIKDFNPKIVGISLPILSIPTTMRIC
jgi:hypothetical protein